MGFIFLNLSFFLLFSNVAFLYLYPLALEAMGNEHHVIGLVMGMFSVAAVLSRPLLGKLVILKGESWVVSFGMGLALLSSLSYNFITAFGLGMLLIRVVHGIGFSAFIASNFSLAAKWIQPKSRGQAFGIIGASLMGAMALAPPIGEFLIRKWNFYVLYISASTSIILAWICVIVAFHSQTQAQKYKKIRASVKYLPLIKDKSFLFLLISTIIFAHCQATVPNFISLIAAEKGVVSGPFFFASYSSAILVLLMTGKIVDRLGKLLFMNRSYPFFALGIALVPMMIASPLFVVSAVLLGAGMGFLFISHNALAAGHGSETEKPAIMAFFTAVYDTGFITGALVSGWFSHLTSLTVLFWSCGILALLGFVTVLFSPIKEV